MKERIKKKLNEHYFRYLAKEEYRNKLNSFLFFLWKVIYKISCLLPVKKRKLLFVANNDFSVPPEYESLKSLAEQKGYVTEFIFKSANSSDVIYKNELKKILIEIKFQISYATSKCTFLYDYYLPAYANYPRKGTRLFQIYHACGAFKKWGYSTKESSWGLKSNFFEKYNVHKTYTYITTSSPQINHIYAEAFGSEISKVKSLGVPRTDVFFSKEFVSAQKGELLKKYPELKSKKLLLWAPTFRGNSIRTSYNENVLDFSLLKELIGNEYAVLVKLHPHVAKSFSLKDLPDELQGFVYDISKEFQISSALCFSDIVISDYSSLIFEYALFERPMIFYAYDLEEYNTGRSFYYDYESFVPGEIVKNTEELAQAILNAENSFNKEKVVAFRERFMSACDGNSTQRVFDLATE
ncbi:MAG: CDP-glycerol glycerophosphotransferase family protein [Clostridia bacterium]|nr:CDP-glycerol glycerophosphotransferase family protein [Clostridia bacterium]